MTTKPKHLRLFQLLAFCLVLVVCTNSCSVIVDSNITMQQALVGTKAPQRIIDSLTLMNVQYYSFDNRIHRGQMVVNKVAEKDVKLFFREARKIKFPINKVIPIVQYHWSDDASMNDNNSSSFNYRLVARTTRVSNHSFGRAMDINPFTNPAVHADGLIEPKNAVYHPDSIGSLNPTSKLVLLMLSLGWEWGGSEHWMKVKGYHDYQHFQKMNCEINIYEDQLKK